jgi:hypothetical protein
MRSCTAHDPGDQRPRTLKTLFAGSTAGLVFVSCFPTRAELRKELTSALQQGWLAKVSGNAKVPSDLG